MQIGPWQPPLQLFSDVEAKAAILGQAKCRLVDRERERDGGGEDVQAHSGTSLSYSVAASHWSITRVTQPRLANREQASEIPSSQNQSQLDKNQGCLTRRSGLC